MKKMRAKKKLLFNDFGKTESERVEKIRKNKVINMNEDELKQYRKKNRDLVRLCTLKKKSLKVKISPNKKSFKSPQSFGKAVRRVEKNLPESPRRRVTVISGLAERHGVALAEAASKAMERTRQGLDIETIDTVIEFFNRVDIVYLLPGMNDFCTVWKEVEKIRERKLYLGFHTA
ncbi:hypothetical protein SNE40_011198 [Patella caerulea]|uniref:Uncharacterized protein n=1 Tax=Patella caerulea TaxID=87958 RepID=A0AAN8JM72_PATCE